MNCAEYQVIQGYCPVIAANSLKQQSQEFFQHVETIASNFLKKKNDDKFPLSKVNVLKLN